MMEGGTTSEPPTGGELPAAPSRWRQWTRDNRWIRTNRLVPLVLLILVIAVVTVDMRRGHPSVNKADVAGIADQRVKQAIAGLQSAPPPGVAVFAAIRQPLVVVQSSTAAADGAKLGTGVIIDAAGDILTALHVVQDATTIKVSFSDGTESPATIATSDVDHDIAVLDAARLPQVVVPAVLGGGPRIGDETFAVGNPIGLVGSLSAGVISGLDRSSPLPNGRTISGLIQFDAAVNPGNSGGPLLNEKGQVIGIVTGLANPSGDDNFAGIGFAVPIGTAGGAAGAPAK